jgi:hypothetical protein
LRIEKLDLPVTTGSGVFNAILTCWRGMLGSRHLVVSRRTFAAYDVESSAAAVVRDAVFMLAVGIAE